jgi:hypothetical protein
MKDPARPDPLAAAHRVKDLARDLAQDLADAYRRSSRYFRIRAAVVGSWAVLSAFAVWASCLPSARTNALGAEVQLLSGSIVGTQVRVRNVSDRLWTEVALTLDDGWRYDRRTIRPGDDLVLSVRKFARDGLPAPEALRPRTLTIECEEGRAVAPLVEE